MSYKFEIKDANLHYGSFQALYDINLDVPQKQVMAFIGPSGCGKSTLLKCLNRMNDLVEGCSVEGDFLLDGDDIYRDIEVTSLRKRVGMVFQKSNLFPMSIYDNIAFGPRTHGIKKKAELDEIVETCLKQAAIWDECKDRLKKSALGMSGGQQQRLCIARALAVKPEVLLMDEPTSALDPISTSKIEDLALDLCARPHLDAESRGALHRAEAQVHYSDSYPQYAAGNENSRQNSLFPARQDRGGRPYRADIQ